MAGITTREGMVVAVMSVGAFAVVLNMTAISPLLGPIARDFGVSDGLAGQVATAGALVGVGATLICAPLMDRISLATWLRLQAGLMIAATAAAALAPSFAWLVVARALAGTTVVLPKCLAACGEIFSDERRRNRTIGIVVSATTLAIVVGLPMLAQIEAVAGWRWAIAAQLVPLVILLLGTRWLPMRAAGTAGRSAIGSGQRYRLALRHQSTRWVLGAMAVFGLVYVGWLTYVGAYVEADFGAGAGILSAIFLAAGAAELVANNVVPLILRRHSAERVFGGAALLLAANLFATGVLDASLIGVFVATAITSVCAAALYIAVSVLLLDQVPAARGVVMALSSAALGIGAAVGSSGVGVVLELFDGYAPAYRFLGLIMLLGVLCIVASRRWRNTTFPAETGFAAVD